MAEVAMAPRANWKGFLKVGEVSCPVALYTAASTSERIAFHTLNRKTGNRLRRVFVDSETGDPVERDDQVKGYEIASGEYIVLDPDEVAAAVPDSDKTLSVSAFIGCDDIDDLYFDKPYYLVPADAHAAEAFALIREGMRGKKVAALAQTVLFRRVRTILIRAHDEGLIATTLNFDYEVRDADEVFADIPEIPIQDEMLDLARHIIKTKRGKFDPRDFDDRYESALADLVRAKIEGRKIQPRREPAPEVPVDLMAALRESASLVGRKPARRTAATGKSRGGGARKTPADRSGSKKAG
jgi:DNA end-binding protein Ku